VLHLGQDDLPVPVARRILGDGVVIGRSTHSPAQFDAGLSEAGVDYVCAGPTWETPTKPGRPAIGLQDIARVHAAVRIPIFCIGGIKLENLDDIIAAGARMGDLDLLPSPFPIEDLLSERELRHVKRLYGIGGLSYGNLSQRKDERRFWMSASGVDKSHLETPGRDILLVSNYDQENGRIVLSVPPDVEPRRVSVDAIEHWMIYQAHPGVGAILHVHAWMEDIPATDVNYPCGTEELAVSVAELLAAEPDPNEAVIGLRNHGITVTGPSLLRILDRIEPTILRQIPML